MLPDEKEVSAAHRAQGVALKFKKGRMILLGESGDALGAALQSRWPGPAPSLRH